MDFATHISHYFEKEFGPLLNICDLDSNKTQELIDRERGVKTGFNRFSCGKEFFDFRRLADDLLFELYSRKFKRLPERRPFFATLGDSDVVGGLYRDPYKIQIPVDFFEEHELTFMCPDHFHLVGLSEIRPERIFGYQPPQDYNEEKYPYFGKLLTLRELKDSFQDLKIDKYLEAQKNKNCWYRYIEVQIWSNPEALKSRFSDWIEVHPEPWSDGKVTHLQNYKIK